MMPDTDDTEADAWTIALAGAPAVGKTRFISRFVLDDFEELGSSSDSMIDQGFSRKLTVDGQKTIVTLLDIYQGQRKLDESYDDNAAETLLRDADGFILMYSTTSPYSFQDVVAYTRAVRRAKAAYAQNPVLSLVANQSDRPAHDQEVTRVDGEALARELDCLFAETSAKTGNGVDDVVEDLVRVLRARKQRRARKQSSSLWGYFTIRR
ncbi:P-loop containing nucleoside triphosphate hydrolase protein [Mycena galopus ATCC 62051]|nr:P-loop containing nucleoside triphosphate hydrolase protein [Mycena galopus ATCC 62051]